MSEAETPEERPLRSPAFRWFFIGRSVSLAGSFMSPVALAFGVLESTGSGAWLSAVLAAAVIPMVATMLIGGGIADRYRRDSVLRLTSLGAGIAQAGVAVVLLTHQRPSLLLPLSALNGIFQGLTTPTLRGILANLVSGRALQQAGSLVASAGNIARILGPSAAGLLTASVGGGWAIAADAATFLASAACFARISLPELPPRAVGDPSMLRAMSEGWTYFRTQTWIWSVTLAFAVFNATTMGFWQVLGPVITSDTVGPKGWGLALSARGAGALLASLILVKLPIMRRPMTPAMTSMALATLPLVLLGAGANLAWLVTATFVAGIVAEFFTVVWVTVTNTHIPERLLSRVSAHDEFWSFLSLPIGQISASALAAVAGTTTVAFAGGGLGAAAMLLAALVPSLHRIEINNKAAAEAAR
ncbi:MFS transporter [Paractinoplanes globisporus]|uniref:MFS transporter n=1 Tax=Paractinoplanes globisporus TaxID=113565 RepID=A0ABW6WBU3_9ACTN|nr:MFS transporter [Actinoplanes globisporus]